jgi:hypothetical protein
MKKIAIALYELTFAPIKFVSEILAGRNNSHQYRQVFIIGPPRSGSTLLSQVLINNYPFFYLYNLLYKTYPATYLFHKIWSLFLKLENNHVLNSNYGDTQGLYGAHEGGNFWGQWFKRSNHHFVDRNYPIRNENALIDTVNALSNTTKKNFLIKNLPCSLRLQVLTRIFPKALFIICERSDLTTAKSILNGRIKYMGDVNAWFGISPKNVSEIMQEKSPYVQVAMQVIAIKKQIESDLVGFEENVYRVSYEELCNKPENSIRKMNDFFIKHNLFSNDFKFQNVSISGIRKIKNTNKDEHDKNIEQAFLSLR